MARITLSKLAHSYCPIRKARAGLRAEELDHVWHDGGAYALLGPSGCGKTTLLNIISGLLHPSQGRVLFNEQDVTDAADRASATSPRCSSSRSIYDTMTVCDNLAFPLRNRGMDAEPKSTRGSTRSPR